MFLYISFRFTENILELTSLLHNLNIIFIHLKICPCFASFYFPILGLQRKYEIYSKVLQLLIYTFNWKVRRKKTSIETHVSVAIILPNIRHLLCVLLLYAFKCNICIIKFASAINHTYLFMIKLISIANTKISKNV